MANFSFVCSECGRRFDGTRSLYVCATCSQQQQRGGPTRGVLTVDIEDLPATWPAGSPADPSALHAFLPIAASDSLPPLAVGNTPLLPAPELRRAIGMPRLWLKDDTRNPSGSTKDRASLLVVAKAREYGFDLS